MQQTKHIVGPGAYATLAIPPLLRGCGLGDRVRTSAVGEVLLQMPARQAGKSWIDAILYALDAGIRGRTV